MSSIGKAIHVASAIRAREMLRVLNERGLIDTASPDVTFHALLLLAMSAFYGVRPFTTVVRICSLIWEVWETQDMPSPEDTLLLQEWQPPAGRKPS